MYDYMVRTAARLWDGTDPAEITLGNEYARGQVELIIDTGIAPYRGEDWDGIKHYVLADIKKYVV